MAWVEKPTNFRHGFICFTLTAAGREWILAENAEGRIFTVGAGLVAELLRVGARFGEAFNERVRDAVSSYLANAPLACCSMCGAAAEAVLLSIAIEIEGNEMRVIDRYRRREGRHLVVSRVVGGMKSEVRDKLTTYFDSIKYYRDLSSHGAPAGLNLATARDKLDLLRALVILVGTRWDELVAQASRARGSLNERS